jgi:hypothetical protein
VRRETVPRDRPTGGPSSAWPTRTASRPDATAGRLTAWSRYAMRSSPLTGRPGNRPAMRERIMVTRAMNPVRASPCHPSDDTPRHGSGRRRTGWRSLGRPLGVEHQADVAADRASFHAQICRPPLREGPGGGRTAAEPGGSGSTRTRTTDGGTRTARCKSERRNHLGDQLPFVRRLPTPGPSGLDADPSLRDVGMAHLLGQKGDRNVG